MNEQFTLPDGTTVGTGNIEPTADQMAMCKSDYRVFGEDYYLDKSDIEKLLKGDRYKEERKKRAPYMINQSRLGKCNASATIAGLHQVRDNAGLPKTVLSDCHLYMRINGDDDQGSLLIDGFKELGRNGVSPRVIEAQGKTFTIPHDVYRKRQLPSGWLDAANKIGTQYKSFEAFTLPDDYPTFKIAVASALARNYPIVFAWHVGNAGMRLSNGYVNNGRGVGNHANLAHSGKWVGGDDLVHADNQNSWGPTADEAYGPKGSAWGDGGFGLFTMESFFRCRKNHMYWVLVGATQEQSANPLA
jgi:hypothetical protein